MPLEKENKLLLASSDGASQIGEGEDAPKPSENQEKGPDDEPSSSFLLFRLPLFQWKSFLLFLGISFSVLLHWFTTSELFDVPPDVVVSRHHFFKAKEGYFVNSTYWDVKQRNFIEYIHQELVQANDQPLLQLLQETPGEILISFLVQKLRGGLHRIEQMAIFPREGSPCSLIISKYETGIWPLKIMLSLELEVKIQSGHFSLSISRLRRGSQDLALGLSWAYFGPELEIIRQLESPSKQSLILLSTFDQIK